MRSRCPVGTWTPKPIKENNPESILLHWKHTYIFLFINGNGGNIASKAAVTASIDLLIKEAGGVEAHSLVSFLQQGSLLPLDLEDLGLDIYKDI